MFIGNTGLYSHCESYAIVIVFFLIYSINWMIEFDYDKKEKKPIIMILVDKLLLIQRWLL